LAQIIHDLYEWSSLREKTVKQTGSLGFVPTMGALHKGHLSLVERSVKENDRNAVSIFVNPTQFDNPADLDNYPQTITEDMKQLEQAGVDVILLPEYEKLYPDNYRYQVSENRFSTKLCGSFRQGHFDGVLTVVMKLLNLVRADRAYFGEKDYQQYLLIKDMVEAFFLPTKIIPCTTIREADGLAFSSRNIRLTPEERRRAPLLYELLKSDMNSREVIECLESSGFVVDYIEEIKNRRYGAVHLGKVRLIDNVPI